jgi:Fic family protein
METLFTETQTIADPVECAAKLHHGISSIHPFADGNGRAARLAMNFVLIAAGYPPVSIATDQRHAYYNALEAADFKTWLNFVIAHLNHELDTWLQALEESQQSIAEPPPSSTDH